MERKMKKVLFALMIMLTGVGMSNYTSVQAHCEIPCGIYDDQLRINLLYEHITTIEKSMNEINELSKAKEINYNQLVRWVNNKEEHANKIQEIVSQYFLHQRVKIKDASDEEAYKTYIAQLTSLHEVLVYAMKAKQTTDVTFITKMQESLHNFEHAYFGDHEE